MPNLVVYLDGQLVLASENGYVEKMLSQTEINTLLRKIESTGFFQVVGTGLGSSLIEDDPIYRFDATPESPSDGAGGYVIEVNGIQSKRVFIYGPYKNFVVPALKATHRLLRSYRPEGLQPYQANRIVLWIEKGDYWRDSCCETYNDLGTPLPTEEPVTWPTEFPSLAKLLGNKLGNQIYIQGELAEKLFQFPISYGVVNDQGIEYFIIVRALLPHESLDDSSIPYPYDVENEF